MMTQTLRELGQVALAFGLDSVRTGAPFVVFCLLQDIEGQIEVTWCVDASSDAAVLRARHAAASSNAVRYAIGRHEEILDREGVNRAAIVVELAEREAPSAVRMAQPYRPFGSPTSRAEAIGTPIVLGDTPSAWQDTVATPGPAPSLVVLCPSCSRKNRVSLGRVRRSLPTCGACRKSLLG